MAQLAHGFGGLRLGGIEHLDDPIQIGVVLGQRPQATGDSRELGERCAFGLRQSLERRLRAGEEARAVLQALMLGGDLLPFAFARRQLFQVGHSLRDVRALGLTLRELGARLGGDFFQPLPVAEPLRGLARQGFGAGMRVEQLALRGSAQQRLVRMLAVQVEQPFAGFLELGKRGGVAVDEAARPAGAVDRAAQNQLAGVAGQVALGEPGRHGFGNLEFTRQLGALGAFAHHRRIAAAADQKLDGIDQNRLAGAGLAGEDGEALGELERGVVDQDVVADLQSTQHDYPGLTRTSLQPSFSRSVAK